MIGPDRRTRLVWRILFLLLIITPIFNLQELLLLMRGELETVSQVAGNYFIKFAKDIGYLSLLLIGADFYLRRTDYWIASFFFVFFSAVALSFLISVASVGVMVAVSGLRWAVPVLLIAVLQGFPWRSGFERLSGLLFYLGLANFAVQLFELFTMPHWYGTNLLGLPGRVPGFFLLPNTCAFFAVTVYALVAFDPAAGRARRGVATLALFTSVLLTQSGTGIVAFTICAVYRYSNTVSGKLLWYATLLAIPVLVLSLGTLTGRGDDYLVESGGKRLSILRDVVVNSTPVSIEFGKYTNTGNLLLSLDSPQEEVLATDSTVASVIGNTGWFGAIALLGLFLRYLYLFYRSGCRRGIAIMLSYAIFSLTTIVFEAFPMNLILAVALAYLATDSSSTGAGGHRKWMARGANV